MRLRALAAATTVAALTAVSGAIPTAAASHPNAATMVVAFPTAAATAATAANPIEESIRFPNRKLDNASKALDYINERLTNLEIQMNESFSFHFLATLATTTNRILQPA